MVCVKKKLFFTVYLPAYVLKILARLTITNTISNLPFCVVFFGTNPCFPHPTSVYPFPNPKQYKMYICTCDIYTRICQRAYSPWKSRLIDRLHGYSRVTL